MKNRDKFRDEILEAFAGSFVNKDCSFMKEHIIPKYDSKKHTPEGTCENVSCGTCLKMFAFWLDEEYEEPPKPEVDWSKVPVDTLVRVRDRENQEWTLMYFKEISDTNPPYKFKVWCNGATSKTACDGDYVGWIYCELVEEEIDQLLKGGDVIDH